jgi:hypothetical protein
MVAWIAIAGLTCLALWPALRHDPVAVVRRVVEFVDATGGRPHEGGAFFLGQPVEDPGPLYYPLAVLFRATPLMLVGLGVITYALVCSRRRVVAVRPIVLLSLYAFGFALMMAFGPKKGDRYLLPVFPVLDLLAGVGLWHSWQLVRRTAADGGGERAEKTVLAAQRSISRDRFLACSLGLALLVVAIWPLMSVRPYYLAYFNPLVGGGPAALWAIDIGWGEGLDQAAAYLNADPRVEQETTIAADNSNVLRAHLHSGRVIPLDKAASADYVIQYVNEVQITQRWEPSREFLGKDPEHTVWINGIEYARVYQGPR